MRVVKGDWQTNSENEHIETPEQEIQRLALLYGVSCEIKFDLVFLRTKCEEFYFSLTDGDTIRLMHKNSCNRTKKGLKFSHEYHHQFTKQITYEELMKYIVKHTKARYKINSNIIA